MYRAFIAMSAAYSATATASSATVAPRQRKSATPPRCTTPHVVKSAHSARNAPNVDAGSTRARNIWQPPKPARSARYQLLVCTAKQSCATRDIADTFAAPLSSRPFSASWT